MMSMYYDVKRSCEWQDKARERGEQIEWREVGAREKLKEKREWGCPRPTCCPRSPSMMPMATKVEWKWAQDSPSWSRDDPKTPQLGVGIALRPRIFGAQMAPRPLRSDELPARAKKNKKPLQEICVFLRKIFVFLRKYWFSCEKSWFSCSKSRAILSEVRNGPKRR